ncbi:MAG TPA: GGDEF domain-containing protein [Rubrobacteraceae bacterium]|nr:GGDEF domain-containing protein [Rubrobacteraceae bacterium]
MHTETEYAAVNRPHLVVLQGPGLGDFFEITDDELVLGSDPFSADIVVRDVEVEPRHAELYKKPGGYAVRGVQAEKTIALNGEVMEEPGCGHLLSDGDRIHVGDSVLEFSHQDEIKASFYEQLHRLVNRDHLTGLFSKGRFDREFEHRLEAMADEGRPLSVLMADIDSLKKINDANGHLLGEFVVGEIGHIIGAMHKEEGRSATRFGGDEYQTVLPDLSKEEAFEVAEEIRRRVETHIFERDDVAATTTISIGVASYPEDGTTHQELTHAADAALYRAKRAGGNTVCD